MAEASVETRARHVVQRREDFRGEARANVLRVVSIGVFYLIELVNRYGVNLGVIEIPPVRDETFHRSITALASAWVLMALAIHLLLIARRFPPWLKYLTTALDGILLTMVLLVAEGPRSPLVMGYALIIAMSAFRLNAALSQFATCVAVSGYLGLIATVYLETHRDVTVPRYVELFTIAALSLIGVSVCMSIHRTWHVVDEYGDQLKRSEEVEPS